MAKSENYSGKLWNRIETELNEALKANPSQEALKALVRWWVPDMDETDARFEAGLVLLAAFYIGHQDRDHLARLTGIPLERVHRFAERLEECRVWLPGGKTACTWGEFGNEEAVMFWEDVEVARGVLKRSEGRDGTFSYRQT